MRSKQPRPPTSQELEELTSYLELEAELSGRNEAEGLASHYVSSAHISVFDHYSAADDSYCGKIMMVVWAQRLDGFQLFIWKPGGLDRVNHADFFEILQPSHTYSFERF